MTDQSIVCPHCGKIIPLTEALTHPIEEKLRKEFDSAAKKMEREHEAQIVAVKKAQAEEFAGEREWSLLPGSLAGASFGNRSGPRLGAMAGFRSIKTTKGRRKLTSALLSPQFCQRASVTLVVLMAYG